MLKNIIKAMRVISHALDRCFSITRWSIADAYGARFEAICNDEGYTMETGAGSRIISADKSSLVLQDIDFYSLNRNDSSYMKILFDINMPFPVRDSAVKHVCSRFTLEHIADTNNALKEYARILDKGGRIILLFSSRNAEFALLNRIIPRFVHKSMNVFFPNQDNSKHGYEAYYDHCTAGEITKLLESNDMRIVSVVCHYFSAPYFDFFPLLYFIILIYEELLSILKIEKLCSYVMIEALKD